MHSILIALLIGSLGGIVAALCGVGGGVVMVPALVIWMGLSQKTAVATSLAAIIFTAMMASFRNHGNSFIEWKYAIPLGLAGGLVAFFAADALRHLSNTTLTKIFGCVMIFIGLYMMLRK
jgi:uncharacterized membrane protein YfcA